MKALGLEGKATATVAGPGGIEWAQPILDSLGPLPGAMLNDTAHLVGGTKTQTTRYLKVGCSMCDWTARVTCKHLDHGTLNCPVGECDGELRQAAWAAIGNVRDWWKAAIWHRG